MTRQEKGDLLTT